MSRGPVFFVSVRRASIALLVRQARRRVHLMGSGGALSFQAVDGGWRRSGAASEARRARGNASRCAPVMSTSADSGAPSSDNLKLPPGQRNAQAYVERRRARATHRQGVPHPVGRLRRAGSMKRSPRQRGRQGRRWSTPASSSTGRRPLDLPLCNRLVIPIQDEGAAPGRRAFGGRALSAEDNPSI